MWETSLLIVSYWKSCQYQDRIMITAATDHMFTSLLFYDYSIWSLQDWELGKITNVLPPQPHVLLSDFFTLTLLTDLNFLFALIISNANRIELICYFTTRWKNKEILTSFGVLTFFVRWDMFSLLVHSVLYKIPIKLKLFISHVLILFRAHMKSMSCGANQ